MSFFSDPASRRTFLARLTGAAVAAMALPALGQTRNRTKREEDQTSPTASGQNGTGHPFQLPPLPYDDDALEPVIDAQTMRLHHDKHHQGYVDNLNKALKDQPELQGRSLEELIRGLNDLPQSVQTAVRNNGGGHLNHSMFWESMKPGGAELPSGALADAIQAELGGLDALQTKFNDAGKGVFGSGWAWLVVDENGKLEITSTPNQDNPLTVGKTPILGNDVWEHAYYLKYQNKRADYLQNWWKVVDWKKVAERYDAAAKKA